MEIGSAAGRPHPNGGLFLALFPMPPCPAMEHVFQSGK
jgi:hypothetical protein